MKELVVISGKGGTGKTSIVASFAALAERAVLADCDVDAADLHLVMAPKVQQEQDFSGGVQARIQPEPCMQCGMCQDFCRFDAIRQGAGGDDPNAFSVDPLACEGCGVCAHFCPGGAIELNPAINGQWFISETRHGPMVHARLGVAEENSGKLVSLLRQEAKKTAEKHDADLIIIDGSPGIGCAVIASITNADLTLVITEPTLSGMHDLGRVADLTRHFGIPTLVCINKWDLNPEIASEIEKQATDRGLRVIGRVRYDRAVTEAQVQGVSVVEASDNGAAADIRQSWEAVAETLQSLAQVAQPGAADLQSREDSNP